jgi:hypothetical protein
MPNLSLLGGKGINDEQLAELEKKINFVSPYIGERDYVMGNLMGIEKGNWSKYMSGNLRITSNFIAEFDAIFKHILKKMDQTLDSNTGGYYPTGEGTSPYREIETKLDELSTENKEIAAAQQRLEQKIDSLLEKKP